MWVNSKVAAEILGIKYMSLVQAVYRAKKASKKFCSIKHKILCFNYIDGRGGASGKVLQIWLDEQSENKLISKGYNIEDISDTRTSRAFAKQGLCCDPISAQWQGEYKSSKDRQEEPMHKAVTNKSVTSCHAKAPQVPEIKNNIDIKSHKGSINDEKYNKTSYESLDNGYKNKTMADKESELGEFESGNIRNNKTIDDKANLVREKWEKSDGKNNISGSFCNIHNMGGCAVDNGCGMKNGSFCYCETEDSGVCVTSDNRREISKGINDEKNKANLQEIRNPHISSGKRDNADDSVDEFQSYAVTKEQKVEVEELFDDMNINDDKKADAFLKAKVVKLWLKARDRKVKIDAFLQYININNMYGKRVSKGQIYDWARRYANGGIKGLVDERGGNKPLLVELLGYKEKVDELILASQGKISSYNVYNRLHHHFVSLGLLSHDEFIGKQKEIVAYDSINRYVNKWKKENPTTVLYIEKGYDAAVSSKLAGVGKADWKADFANEYVEIDATTLDLFAKKIRLDLASAIWKINKEAFRDFEECCERVKENQKRYTVVGLIDVRSGVCSYVIGKSENIYTVKRCLAKYIAKFGKPLRVVGDNGKAFKSNEMAGTFESLDIEYLAVRAYSGWLKPYIERSWRSFQDNFSQNIAGFIGHSVEQRQAIEFGFSKMERRLKKGEQTNLKRMLLINDLEKLMDDYIDEFINRRWLDRLGSSPLEAYKSDEDKIERLSSTLVCARLGNMLTKKVYKKGIMHDNAYYICAKSFEYDEVKIVPNINNVDEVYIWSVNGEFIGVGTRLNNGEGVSAEIAKEARAFTKKKIDKVRKAANAAAAINQDSFIEHVEYVKNARALEVGSAALEYEDELGALVKTEHKRAKSLRVINELLVPTKPKKQVEISWEVYAKDKGAK
ncbi:bacteriophage DNA transposition protein A%2C putative [Campylobacter hyointestinalis]|uniref:DDE-type integrase/transposase/recombinase n=1 Tax=Campylobacter hyointestinalis TaxID=198 RepID=UPI00072C4628|nr:DDE-type integrase/transposase/recombinase [Campylobacter hyointestinalis]CUU77898.1 bacteriophage DNA transposition protein A%2C putative [Campylobacter hyointestinalis]